MAHRPTPSRIRRFDLAKFSVLLLARGVAHHAAALCAALLSQPGALAGYAGRPSRRYSSCPTERGPRMESTRSHSCRNPPKAQPAGATTSPAPSHATQAPAAGSRSKPGAQVQAPLTVRRCPSATTATEPEFDSVDAMTRLLLGGAADLSDLFLKILENWEADVVRPSESATIVEQEEDIGDILRYLMIGLAFQSQRQVRSTTKTVGSWLLGAADTTLSITRPVRNSWLFSPARRVTAR